MIEDFDWNATHIACDICGEMVPRGIISYSTHWAEKHGQKQMAFITKLVENKSLKTDDKIDLIRKEFGINQ